MATHSQGPTSKEAGPFNFTFPLLIAVLVFAPLIKGGNRPIPLLVLQLAAVALLILAAMDWARVRKALSPVLLAILGLLLAWPLVQLVPVGEALWAKVPGHDLYVPALTALGLAPAHAAISVVPRATESAWLTLLLPFAVFLATLATPRDKLKLLAYVFVAIAASQAIIGLAQYGTQSYSVIFSGGNPVRNAFGTYANYDHLAGLLEMALPVALALLAANIHPGERAPKAARKPHRPSRRIFEELRTNHVALFSAATVAILLGLIFSRSRTGVALSMVVILLCTIAFARHIGGRRSARFVTVIAVIGATFAVEIGLAPVLARFTEQSASADARWPIFSATWEGIQTFLPIGGGLGTFPHIFRYFQPEDVPLFVNHAHNDYLEWFLEQGVVAGISVLLALLAFIVRFASLMKRPAWTLSGFCQMGAAIGMIALALHGMVDFNLHIPANSIYLSMLAGIVLHAAEGATSAAGNDQARFRNPVATTGRVRTASPSAPNTPNPFGDSGG